MFMVLSREDAIDGMRDMMGPADPEEAKKVAPERFVFRGVSLAGVVTDLLIFENTDQLITRIFDSIQFEYCARHDIMCILQ